MFDDFSTFRDEVKNRVDIIDIVGEYVPLKKRGANYLGLCPFHTEKTPSFTVHREKQFYHCFGCGKGGDVISFLMDISGMSFIETMQHLADRLGLKMPEKRPLDTSINKEKDVILAANLAAAEHFHKTLSGNEGKQALEYLQKRGLSPETIRSFRLGYASNDSTGLLAFAKKKSLSPQDFERAGILLKSRYDTSYYNRFGGRIIFPIIDQNVRIVGFGARLLEGEGAKYINSPESAVYHKSHVLYGIHQAKDPIKKSRKAVVVEGYMDVISLHQAGITNVIASSGTAFTAEQGKTITRMANEAILLFDGDSAGLSAAARGADNLLSTDLTIGVVVLPEGHDPDSFIREKGSEALNTLLNAPQGIWEFKLSVLAKQGITVTERKKLASEIADSLSLIPDDLTRDVHIRELCPKIGVDANSMLKAVNGRIKLRLRQVKAGTSTEPSIGQSDRVLLASLIAFPPLARRFMEEVGAKPFTNPLLKMVADTLFHKTVEGLDVSPSALIGALSDTKAQELIAQVAMIPVDEESAQRSIGENIFRYRKNELWEEIERLKQRVISESNLTKKSVLVKKYNELVEQLNKLKPPSPDKKALRSGHR